MKILLLITTIFLLSSCFFSTEKTQQRVQETQELKQLEQEKAQEVIKEIKQEEANSKALQEFLDKQEINVKEELKKTQQRYNDNLGPILEYEHEKSEQDTQDSENETGTGETDTQTEIKQNEENNTPVYSQEVKIEIQDTFNYINKSGKSGNYKAYIGVSDICKGGLEMTDTQGNSKWLFQNNCKQMIYDFELDFGGIKVYYKDDLGNKKEVFVKIN